MPRTDSITTYEPILWLYPHVYGLRIRDGKWIEEKKKEPLQVSKPVQVLRVCTTKDIDSYLSGANIGDIIYDISYDRFYIYGGYGNRIAFMI